MLYHLPIDPNSRAVVTTGMKADLALYQALPFIFQFGVDPAWHGGNCKAERKKVSTNVQSWIPGPVRLID